MHVKISKKSEFFAQTLGGYYYCEPHDPFLLEINHVLFLIIPIAQLLIIVIKVVKVSV